MSYTLPWTRSRTKDFTTGFIAREEDFNPNQIANILIWLDSSQTSSITDSGGSVSRWNDLSGNSNDVTQSVGSAQPTTGTTTQNGRNILVFDNDGFVMPSGLYPVPNGDHTIFAVAQQAATANERLLNMSASGANRHAIEYTAGGNVFYFNNAVSDTVVAAIDETNFNIITTFLSGTTQSISVNAGTAVTDSAGVNISGIDSAFLGGNAVTSTPQWSGAMAEIIIYERALSASEISTVETYLSNKWAITLS